MVSKKLTELLNLECLILPCNITLSDETIIAISKNCKKLKHLKIPHCRLVQSNNDNVIVKLKGLKKFYCASCKKLTDAGVIQFIHNNPDLEVLDICFIPNITVDTFIAADQATENRVNGVILYIRFYYEDIEEAFELIIKSQCTYHNSKYLADPNIAEIQSQYCVHFLPFTLSHPLIIALSKNCKKLKRLEIAHGTIEESTELRFSSASVLDDLSKLQYLEHLNLSFVADLKNSTILAIANNCKKLKFLNIEGCINITATSLMALTSLKNLQELNVNSHNIKDNFIVKLNGLNRLDCAGCINLTHTGIVQFLNNNPDLEFLDITSIFHMDIIDAANKATKNHSTILAITNNCKKLKFLNIEGCKNITATALMALTSLKNLQELNVNLINITDNVIVKLKGLNRLDCVGCMKLTENGIITFMKNNPDLENLDIRLINYMDIIDAVNEATKNRTNGIILKIHTIDDELIKESKCFITSPWVVFRRNSKRIEIYEDNLYN
ncbi:F-box/LRR-repeat protein 7-like [Aphidius gifuensis]|uniref:F-box/LRR-repeat protein 7-like n=1 Tax=Aphidius gifuensis TaxID=684658 RepID=UPI001CDD3EA1|nr:F-box/LRR-repeat protein 7-like [Aphidius gifuensis]